MPSAPERTCAGCRVLKPKSALLRVVRTPDGTVLFDASGRSEGRGVYLCPKADCLVTALKRGALNRGLKSPVPEKVVSLLKAAVVAAS